MPTTHMVLLFFVEALFQLDGIVTTIDYLGKINIPGPLTYLRVMEFIVIAKSLLLDTTKSNALTILKRVTIFIGS